MTPERWAVLDPLLDAALDLPAERRGAYIAQIAARDASLGEELARLVEQCERGHALLDRPAAERFPVLLAHEGAGAGDALDRLQLGLGAAYTVEREIGGGGMSRVFVAREAALGREVVIKTLAPELAVGFSAERFARETRLAASLQQANIVPLLAAGSAGGLPYYTMPYVEGHSLRHRLAEQGALPIGEAVGILRGVARALSYAHAHGVIHRDIKPANVLLSGGTAVVTDFGIAKAFGAARAEGVEETLTGAGTGLGTPAYMAPEQAAGDPAVDYRADLYAFGCVAYEMFAGRPPFEGDTHEVIAAHFRKTPRPLAELRPETPPRVASLVARCLEKDPARRPESAAALLAALDPASGSAAEGRRRLPGFPGGRLPTGRRLWYAAAGVLLAAAALVALAAYLARPAPPLHLKLAALPFTSMDRDTALDFRGDAIGDEVLGSLVRLSGVEITGRAAAAHYRAAPSLDTVAVERALGARLLLTGTLRRSGGRIIVSAALHDSLTRRVLLADTLQGGAGELGALAEDLAQAISDTLRSRFGARLQGPATERSGTGTTNAEARDLYLLGQALLKRRGTGIQESVATFEHAIALDPGFARAYAALADALEYSPYFVGTAPADVFDRAVNAAHRALELDSTLAEAHVALGAAYAYVGRWAASDAEFRHAFALQPDNASAHFTFGRLLVNQGREEEAHVQFEKARRLEPVSSLISAWLAETQFVLGQRDSARIEIDRALQLDSTQLASSNLGALLVLALGQPDRARRLSALSVPVGVMTTAPYIYAALGDTARANAMVRAMEANSPRPWFTDVEWGLVRLATGDTAGALTALETAAGRVGPMWIGPMPVRAPAFDPVRRSPRFAALLRQAGLDAASLTGGNGGRR